MKMIYVTAYGQDYTTPEVPKNVSSNFPFQKPTQCTQTDVDLTIKFRKCLRLLQMYQ